jgi:hypothetical protein
VRAFSTSASFRAYDNRNSTQMNFYRATNAATSLAIYHHSSDSPVISIPLISGNTNATPYLWQYYLQFNTSNFTGYQTAIDNSNLSYINW